MRRPRALYVSILTALVFAQASAAQWTPWQPLTANDSIGSPGGTHPLVVDGNTVHAVWWQSGTIWYRRSDNAGRTWSQAVPLTASGKAQYPCSLELAGTVLHLFWTNDRNDGWELYYRRSADAGNTWEEEARLTPGIDMFRFGTAVAGTNVHIVWGSRSRLEKVPVGHSSWTWTWGDIYHLASVDGGKTWGTPLRLNRQPGTAMRPAVAAAGDVVHVTWYDQCAAKQNPAWDWDIYYRRSLDSGATWDSEARMTSTPTHSRHPQIVTTSANRVCCLWEDGQVFDGAGMVGDPALYAAVSTDNGETWGKSRRITAIHAPNGFATHAKAYGSGSRVHLTWQDAPEGPQQSRAIYYLTSPDGGLTWGTPERLTPDAEEGWETGGVVGTQSWALIEAMKGGRLWYCRRDLTSDPDLRAWQTSGQTVLGIQETRFSLNGQPTFLLGISYYGALGASEEFIRRDLDDAQRYGFNWVRVWATWAAFDADVSALDGQGGPREPFLSKLQWLLAECDRRGVVVDVTLTRKQQPRTAPASGGLADLASHERAVETLINALKPHRNWYLDFANERDVRDARFVSPAELKSLRDLARQLDPELLVTASTGGHDLTESDVRDSLVTAGCDFLSPHRPRDPKSPSQTEAQTRACLALAKALNRVVPVQYQEPFRRGYERWEPTSGDFLSDLRGAVAGGAAGWCFHNGSERGAPGNQPRRSFDLRAKRLFDQLDPEELKVVSSVRAALSFHVPRMWEYSAPLIAPENRKDIPSRAQKDPSVVFYDGKWHVFMTVKLPGKSAIEYCSFTSWENANVSPRTILKVSDSDYYCAPQVFYFRPHRKWYLIYQVGVPGRDKMWVAYSTTADIDDPQSWTRATPMLDGGKDDPRKVGGLDYWIICDQKRAYLFLTSLDGRMWRLWTRLEEFPRAFDHCEPALQARVFEASHTYKLKGVDQYLTIIEENCRRYYKAYVADQLDGEWVPFADTAERPFAGWNNIRPAPGVEPWTDNISHGELIRDGVDETLTVDPSDLRFVFQGMWDKHKSGKEYGQFQWRIGILTPAVSERTSGAAIKIGDGRPP